MTTSAKSPPNLSIVVPGGNPVDLVGTWYHRSSGEPRAPTAVRFQVFDYETKANLGAQQVVDVELLAATMRFTVPGAALPGPAGAGDPRDRRRLLVKVEALFGLGDPHTEYFDVFTERGVPWV